MGKDDAKGGVCLKCGKSDPLNIRYCVFCGAALGDPKASTIKDIPQKSSSSKVPEVKSPRKTATGLAATGPVKPGEVKSPRKTITGLAALSPASSGRSVYFGKSPRPSLKMIGLAIAGGLIVGLPIGMLAGHTELSNMLAQQSWPSQGLLVFADTPYAHVAVADERDQRFTVGQCGPDGELSLSDLAPGRYSIAIEAPGAKPYTQSLDLKSDKPSNIGYPSRITLTPSK